MQPGIQNRNFSDHIKIMLIENFKNKKITGTVFPKVFVSYIKATGTLVSEHFLQLLIQEANALSFSCYSER